MQDISHVGDTAASALKRAEREGIESPLVVIEIGGNDVLGFTTTDEFAADLEALLAFATQQNRRVLLFELPLPPFFHEYGRIQRTLAKKHGVKLLPKRVFLSVLAADASTLDSIHLSQSGHRRMARTIGGIIEPALPQLIGADAFSSFVWQPGPHW